MASLKFEEPFLMGCMFKCISYVFGAGPPRSLDLLGVGNPGKKRQLGIGTVLQYPMFCTSKKHDDISSTSLVITVIYIYMYITCHICMCGCGGEPSTLHTYYTYSTCHYTPEQHDWTWKWWLPKGFSYSRGWFSGSMLNFRGVPNVYLFHSYSKTSFRHVSFGWLMFLIKQS